MGQLEQFAKRTFAEDTERLTGGGAVWEDPPEIQLGPVQSDGLLIVRRAEALARLPPPWCEALGGDEVLVEIKMSGDHLDVPSVERALLRRQGRRVQRVEAAAAESVPWPPQEALWLIAPHVPTWLREEYEVTTISAGCYRVGPTQFPFLWIAANSLPLADELVPFLVARSGKSRDDFILWAATRRPLSWVLEMLEYLPMSNALRQDVLERLTRSSDPEIAARQREIVQTMLDLLPDVKQRIFDEGAQKGAHDGRLFEARDALRRLLSRRGLVLTPEDDARIEDCEDLVLLKRWHDQAITAPTTAEALQ